MNIKVYCNHRNEIRKWLGITTLIVSLSWCSLAPQALLAQTFPQDTAQALNMANFILSLEDANGAIADNPGATTANNDSNAEYALMGLAAAYSYSGDIKYLTGFENGIAWLAAREEMTDPFWKGSWYLQYSSTSPYAEVPSPAGSSVSNVRGVDATSTLFVYLLYLDQKITGSNTLVLQYQANAEAALSFEINHNLAETVNNNGTTSNNADGLSWSSWLYHTNAKKSELYLEKYTDDQGDVYLGMEAGYKLYNIAQYGQVASNLQATTPKEIWNTTLSMYPAGLSSGPGIGVLDNSLNGYDEGMTQGYLAWMWGNTTKDQEGMNWLRSKQLSNGSIKTKPNKQAYSMNAGFMGIGDVGLAAPAPVAAFTYLIDYPYDPNTGGVEDSLKTGDLTQIDNVAGFCILGLLGPPAF